VIQATLSKNTNWIKESNLSWLEKSPVPKDDRSYATFAAVVAAAPLPQRSLETSENRVLDPLSAIGSRVGGSYSSNYSRYKAYGAATVDFLEDAPRLSLSRTWAPDNSDTKSHHESEPAFSRLGWPGPE